MMDDEILFSFCPESLRWPQCLVIGRQKIVSTSLELLHDLHCLDLLEMAVKDRSRHEKISYFFIKEKKSSFHFSKISALAYSS